MARKELLDVQTTLRTANTAVVELRGELDVATADQLRDHLMALVELGDRKLILDLAGLEFVDSTGLAAFIGVDRRLRPLGGSLEVANVRGQPSKVMELTGVLRALKAAAVPGAAVVLPDTDAAPTSDDGSVGSSPTRHDDIA